MCGGCAARINIENGHVETPFYDLSNHIYRAHSISGVKMEGMRIPSWENVIKTVKEAVRIVPDMGYTSWDIAVVKGGKVAIVEGNSYGNFNIQQVSGSGVRKKYEGYMRMWRENKKIVFEWDFIIMIRQNDGWTVLIPAEYRLTTGLNG